MRATGIAGKQVRGEGRRGAATGTARRRALPHPLARLGGALREAQRWQHAVAIRPVVSAAEHRLGLEQAEGGGGQGLSGGQRPGTVAGCFDFFNMVKQGCRVFAAISRT